MPWTGSPKFKVFFFRAIIGISFFSACPRCHSIAVLRPGYSLPSGAPQQSIHAAAGAFAHVGVFTNKTIIGSTKRIRFVVLCFCFQQIIIPWFSIALVVVFTNKSASPLLLFSPTRQHRPRCCFHQKVSIALVGVFTNKSIICSTKRINFIVLCFFFQQIIIPWSFYDFSNHGLNI